MLRICLKNLKVYFFYIYNFPFTIRHWLKLQIFKSPMGEYSSLRYAFYKIKAQFLFKFKVKDYFNKNKYIADKYNEFGYATFSNNEIKKNSEAILDKISNLNKPWKNQGRLDYSNIEDLKNEFIQIFDNGVDAFIKSSFNSDYRIFYHVIYRSKNLNNQIPEGSALWHADGGPGICMNLMICHTPVDSFNGAMKVIPWKYSKNILVKTFYNYKNWRIKKSKNELKSFDRNSHRSIKCESLRKLIDTKSIKYFQPNTNKSGLIYAFNNNCVHAGGFTKPGFERIVSVMHIYPSTKVTTLKEKFKTNHKKIEPYPKNL